MAHLRDRSAGSDSAEGVQRERSAAARSLTVLAGAAIVAHGGGPTPVLNASLAGVIAEAQRASVFTEIYGAEFGLTGLVEERFFDLSALDAGALENIAETPSSVLGSSRRGLTEEEDERILAM